MCVFAQGFLKLRVPTATPQPLRRQLPFQGRFSRCPLWGWCSAQRIRIAMIAGGNHTSVSCREAAKGVPLAALSCYHSTDDTPSVSPYGLPAPPSGSRGIVRIRPRFLKTAGAYRNPSAAAAAAPLSGALFSLPPLGVVLRAANQDSNDCRWQSYLCFVPRQRQRGCRWQL